MSRPIGLARRNVQRVLWDYVNATSAPAIAQWDASDAPHIITNGGNVASWIDRIGGLSCAQSSASKQPALSATARNSKPGIVYTGSSQQTLGPSAQGNLPQGKTIHTVLIVGYANASGPMKSIVWGGQNASTTRTFGNRSSYYESGTNGSGNDATTTIAWNGNDLISICDFDPTSLAANNYANGGVSPQTISVSASTMGAGGAYIGSFQDIQEYWTGVIQEIVIFSGRLSTSERNKAFGRAAWKWGQVGNLSSANPYTSRAPFVTDP